MVFEYFTCKKCDSFLKPMIQSLVEDFNILRCIDAL